MLEIIKILQQILKNILKMVFSSIVSKYIGRIFFLFVILIIRFSFEILNTYEILKIFFTCKNQQQVQKHKYVFISPSGWFIGPKNDRSIILLFKGKKKSTDYFHHTINLGYSKSYVILQLSSRLSRCMFQNNDFFLKLSFIRLK